MTTIASELLVDPRLRTALADVYDPCCREKGISVVDMGLLHRARIEDGTAHIELLLTSGWCPFASAVLSEVGTAAEALPGVERAEVEIVWDQAWAPDRLSDDARAKLRFLPDPARVTDPTTYRDQHLTTSNSGDN